MHFVLLVKRIRVDTIHSSIDTRVRIFIIKVYEKMCGVSVCVSVSCAGSTGTKAR